MLRVDDSGGAIGAFAQESVCGGTKEPSEYTKFLDCLTTSPFLKQLRGCLVGYMS